MGEMEGIGKEIFFEDGRTYEGEFLKGKKHGHGVEVKPGKLSYDGEWVNNYKDGTGWETQLLGCTRRQGQWKKGKWMRWLSGTETVSGSIHNNPQYRKDFDELAIRQKIALQNAA